MAAPARRAPATHPTVYVGLGLAVVGLLLATYAYTGSRVYDSAFALVALAGGVLALLGIMTAAWGRAVMGARAQRRARGRPAPEPAPGLPTVAAPEGKSEKRRIPFPIPRRAKRETGEAKPASNLFSFRRRSAPPPAPEEPAPPEAVIEAPAPEPVPAPPAVEVAVAEAPVAAPAPVLERVTLRCPRCATTFTAEGARPFAATCPSCALVAEV
ncbi:MAG TPA: hypothetical protein VHH36_06065 [Candidatus Thermoplasmatota archaeon]|nr:hypothetical protein [Candidatus Thermoplasmatota archaeon]